MHTYICLYRRFVIVRGLFVLGFCPRVFCLKGFVRGGFIHTPFCQNTSVTTKKLNITFNFRICMYEKFVKSLTSHALGPPPVTNCHTFSDPSSLGSDVLYGRPLKY